MNESLESYTICVVDDDEAVRVALTRLLRGDGWRVASFESAEAFLADWNRAHLVCLVLDVDLPGLDGLAHHGERRSKPR